MDWKQVHLGKQTPLKEMEAMDTISVPTGPATAAPEGTGPSSYASEDHNSWVIAEDKQMTECQRKSCKHSHGQSALEAGSQLDG